MPVRILGYFLALAAGLPIFLGWAVLGSAATAGLTTGSAALAALLFALAVQIFGMAGEVGPAPNVRKRRENIHEANLLRGLLANVLYCTLWTLLASLAAVASSFINWLWVGRTLLAVATGAFVIGMLSFLLTIRRLLDLADQRLNRALDPPEEVPAPSKEARHLDH